MEKYRSLHKLNSAVKKRPHDAELLRERAMYLLDLGGQDAELAKKDILKAKKLDPNATNNYTLMSYYHIFKRSFKTALYYAQKACELEPENTTNFYYRGLCFHGLRQSSKAIDDYSLVSPHSPKYIIALTNRAICYHSIKSYQAEVNDLFKIISLTFEYDLMNRIEEQQWREIVSSVQPGAMLDFLKVYHNAQKDQDIIATYTRVIETDDTQPVFYVFRGKSFLQKNDEEKALLDFNKALELNKSARIFALRAETLARLGKHEKALTDWKMAISIAPLLDYYVGYAESCFILAQNSDSGLEWLAKAKKYFRKIIRLNPEHALSLLRLANIYEQETNQERAKRYYKEAIKYAEVGENLAVEEFACLNKKLLSYYPDSEEYILRMAECADFYLEDYSTAINCYIKLIQLNRSNIEYYIKIADLYWERHQFLEVIQYSETGLKIEPQNIQLLKYCAVCNMKLERFNDAIPYVEILESIKDSHFFLDAGYCRFKLGDEIGSLKSVHKYSLDDGFTPSTVMPDSPTPYGHRSITIFQSYHNDENAILEFIATILQDSSFTYFAQTSLILLKIIGIEVDFITKTHVVPDIESDNDAEIIDEKEKQFLNSLLEYYTDFRELWHIVKKRDVEKLCNIRLKLALYEYLAKVVFDSSDRKRIKKDNEVISANILNTIRREITLIERAELKLIHEHALAESRIQERNKIIADLSHSIKNMISTVIDPLESLQNENTVQPKVLENALRGANLIREIVNAMNLSFKGSIEDFLYDTQHAYSSTAISLQEMLRQSVVNSITNMFDGKYFNIFMRQYFTDKDAFLLAKTAWENISHSPDILAFLPFLEEYFFTIKINIDLSGHLTIGNDKGSAIKLLILFQEIVLNAVKYCSFVPKSERVININLLESGDKILLRVENSFQADIVGKTTGIGHILIDNFTSWSIPENCDTQLSHKIWNFKL